MCKYCKPKGQIKQGEPLTQVSVIVEIWPDAVLNIATEDGDIKIKIKYCPMCGKKL